MVKGCWIYLALGGLILGGNAAAVTCGAGYYQSGDTCLKPPAGAIANGGTQYWYCSWSAYANADQSKCLPCPPEYPATGSSGTSINGCYRICPGGTYMASTTDTECTPVGPDSWAPATLYYYGTDAHSLGTLHHCPPNTQTRGTIGYGANDAGDCARTLHLGTGTMRLRGTKSTSPAMAVSVGGQTYWASMATTTSPITDGVTQQMKISYNATPYYVFDDTFATRVQYPWDTLDFEWYTIGTYTFNKSAKTWTAQFGDNNWSGDAKCEGMQCYCRMLSPAVSEWYPKGANNCETDCAMECGWAFGSSSSYRYNLIMRVAQHDNQAF